MDVNEMFEAYESLLMNGAMPEIMIVGDAQMIEAAGLPPGTYLFVKGQEPRKLGELKDFDRIWQDALLGHHYE